MKLQLIMLETPIIVSDETPEVEDIVFLGNSYNYISKVTNMIGGSLRDVVLEKMPEQRKNGTLDYREMSKIIAGLPSLPSINFNGFEEQLGIVDVEKLKQKVLNKYIGKLSKSGHSAEDIDRITDRDWFGLWEGFKIAQQLNEKKFNLEDIKSAYFNGGDDKDGQEFDYFFNRLQQPKIYDIEVEVINKAGKGHGLIPTNIPKIINNQIKITKICGT